MFQTYFQSGILLVLLVELPSHLSECQNEGGVESIIEKKCSKCLNHYGFWYGTALVFLMCLKWIRGVVSGAKGLTSPLGLALHPTATP